MKKFLSLALACLCLDAGLAQAQNINPILSNFGPAASSYNGARVGRAGDLNLDGIQDWFSTGVFSNNGAVRIFSGLNGAQLLELTTPQPLGSIPMAAGIGDVNSDGIVDFAVSDAGNNPTQDGIVWVFSGIDGSILYSFSGVNPQFYMGYYLASMSDVDGDGRPDFAVSPISTGAIGGSIISVMQVRSGATGNVIYSIMPAQGQQTYVDDFRSIPDVNNDGQRDILMSISVSTGYVVEIRSGINGALLSTASSIGSTAGSVLPGVPSIAGVQSILQIDSLRGDINGDGVNDFVVGDPSYVLPTDGIAPRGAIHFLSGANLTNRLATILGGTQGEYMGGALSAIGDADNNGVPDVAVGSTGGIPVPGYLKVYAAIPTPLNGPGIVLGSLNLSAADSSSLVHVASLGDLNGDGFAEFLFGNTGADNGATVDAGLASLLTLKANYVPPVPNTSPSPSPSPSATVSASPAPSASASPTASASPAPSASASPTASSSPAPSASPIGGSSPTPSASPVGSASASPSPSPNASSSPSPGATAVPSVQPSASPSSSPVGGISPSPSPNGSSTNGGGVQISSLPTIGLTASLRRNTFRVNFAPTENINSSVFNDYTCAAKLEASTRTGTAFDRRAIALAYIPYSSNSRVILRANRVPLVRVRNLKSKPKIYLRANLTCTRPSQIAGLSEALVRDSGILAINAPKTTRRTGVSLGSVIGRIRRIIAL